MGRVGADAGGRVQTSPGTSWTSLHRLGAGFADFEDRPSHRLRHHGRQTQFYRLRDVLRDLLFPFEPTAECGLLAADSILIAADARPIWGLYALQFGFNLDVF